MPKGLPAQRRGGQRRTTRSREASPSSQGKLSLQNRHRACRVDQRLLRQIVLAILREKWPSGAFDLGIYLVADPEMTHLNETFLQHQGSTDVITFDYAEKPGHAPRRSLPVRPRPNLPPPLLHGELFVCLDEALLQARRFHTTWQAESVRYVVHGILHLLGYDDQESKARRRMKKEEDACVRQLAHRFDFQRLGPTLGLSLEKHGLSA
jgi:probable rRNA maturation factor